MKYTIHGFSQQKAIELGLDDRDLMILRWFVDYKDTGKMVKKILDNDMYYWIKYEGIQEAFPIINWKKDTIYRRLKAMALKGVLKHKTVKEFGTYSFYAIGPNYLGLTDTECEIAIGIKSDRSDSNPRVTEINPIETDSNPKETEINPEHNINLLNSSIKDSSIKNSSIKNTMVGVVDNELGTVFDYFTKHNFMLSPAQYDLIKADYEQFPKDEILKAIEISDNNSKRTYNYFKGVLNKIHTEGIKNEKPKVKISFGLDNSEFGWR